MPNLYNTEERQSFTTAPVEHYIETGNARPVVARGKRLSPKENQVVDDQVETLLQKGVIRASKSPWCANPVVVPKPNGDYRFCTNFRGLNQVTIKDKFPLPRMEDLLDKLLGSTWYHCIDLNSAYFQIPIFEDHKCKTAFRSSKGLWEYNSLAQGLCNSSATFARYMENILSSVQDYTIKYLDDILCHADTKEASLEQLKQVLYILNHWNLKINLKKCQFLQQEVRFLGFIISGSGVKSNPDKILPIKTWKAPKTTQELMQFLGICTFYHKFVRNLAETAAPLYHLLKKDTPFVWTTKCEDAFQALKDTLIQLPELAFPDGNLPYDLHCDASNVALGSVLVQAGRPIAYASRTLTPAERNYSTTERECLSVAWSLQYFHCYVHGATLMIYTDHSALKALLGTKDPKGRIARWILDIWTYEFTLLHRKGKDNLDADALSRTEIQNNITHIASQTALTMDELIKAQRNDPELQQIINTGNIEYPYMLKEGVLCYIKFNPPVIVVPTVWRQAFLKRIHEHPTSGHLGRDKTLARAKDNGFWVTMNADVKNYVSNIEVGAAGDRWAADIAYLPTTKGGHRYLLVMMEYLTKWVITVPLVSAAADAIANALMFEIILKYGTPKELLTDNGTNFISETVNIICSRLNIAKIQTSVEAPSTDGLVERMNRTIKASLSIYCQNDPSVWDQYLPLITFAINTAKQASTEVSPFEAMYGRKPKLPSLHDLPSVSFKTYSAQAWSNYLSHYIPLLHTRIRQNIQKHQQQQQRYYNHNRKEKELFQEGDVVLKVKPKDSWKFGEPKLVGPYKIIKINKSNNACTLEDISNKNGKRKRKTAAIITANFRDIYRMK